MSKVLLIQRTNLSANLGLVVPCSQSIPRRELDQRHHCAICCNETERHDGCWMFRFWQSAGTLVLSPKRQVAVVPSFSNRIDSPNLLIWEDNHPCSRSRLEVINKHLITVKALGADSRREQWSFHNNTRVGFKLHYSSYSIGAAPTPSFLACWRMKVLGLLRMAYRKLSRPTTVCRILFARLLTLSLLPICTSWSHRRLCEMSRQGLRPHSLCVPHKEVQQLSLDCLSAESFWNAQQ